MCIFALPLPFPVCAGLTETTESATGTDTGTETPDIVQIKKFGARYIRRSVVWMRPGGTGSVLGAETVVR